MSRDHVASVRADPRPTPDPVAAWVADGLRISGALTWVMATVIVWAAALVAGLLLPVLLVKRAVRGEPGPDVTDWGRSRLRAPRGSGGLG